MQVLNFYKLGKKIPDGAIYIGRSMPHEGLVGSKFANKFKITETDTREIVVEKYKKWLWGEIRSGRITLEDLLELEGHDLVCFCKQDGKEVACHGDVLVKAVAWARRKYDTVHGYWEY